MRSPVRIWLAAPIFLCIISMQRIFCFPSHNWRPYPLFNREVGGFPQGPAPWDTVASSNLVSLSRKVLKPQWFWDFFFFLRPGSVPRFPSLSFKLADHHRQQVQQIFGHFGLLFQKSDYFFCLIEIGISSFLFHCLKKVLFHQPCQLLALGVIRK